jgi:hypothetical protein
MRKMCCSPVQLLRKILVYSHLYLCIGGIVSIQCVARYNKVPMTGAVTISHGPVMDGRRISLFGIDRWKELLRQGLAQARLCHRGWQGHAAEAMELVGFLQSAR